MKNEWRVRILEKAGQDTWEVYKKKQNGAEDSMGCFPTWRAAHDLAVKLNSGQETYNPLD